MKNIFYSKSEKISFWISNYDISSVNAYEIIEYLQVNTNKATDILKVGYNDIFTFVILSSIRYKGMRVFYAYTDIIPESAFILDEDWTMSKWIHC